MKENLFLPQISSFEVKNTKNTKSVIIGSSVKIASFKHFFVFGVFKSNLILTFKCLMAHLFKNFEFHFSLSLWRKKCCP